LREPQPQHQRGPHSLPTKKVQFDQKQTQQDQLGTDQTEMGQRIKNQPPPEEVDEPHQKEE
jgi:hypothetical protein